MIDNNLEGMDISKAKPINQIGIIGSDGISRYGGYISEEFLTNLTGTKYLKVFKEMSYNDATIGAILFIFEQMIRKVPWYVRAASDKEEDKKAAEFVQECMDDMSHSWFDFITESLSMFVYGWTWHELCYKYRKGYKSDAEKSSKYNDNRIGWSKLPRRMQTSWNSWVYDKENPDRLVGMEQNSPTANTTVIIPESKSLHFRTKPMGGNPEGISLLRNAYRSWYFKKRIEEIEGIGIERDLAGLPVITTPEGVNVFDTSDPDAVKLKAALEKLISNIRRDKNEGALLPFGYVLELLTTGSSRTFDTNAIINRYDQRIAMSMLSDLIMLGADKSGSFALADVKKSLLSAALEAQLANISDIINKVAIPRLMMLNTFNTENFPEIFPGEIETPDMTDLADGMQRFTDMGFAFFPDPKLEEYIWNNFGFPKVEQMNKTPDGITREQKMQEEQAEQAQENMEQQAKLKGAEQNSKPVSARARATHQTDDKSKFNSTYERTGLKKLVDAITKLGRKK